MNMNTVVAYCSWFYTCGSIHVLYMYTIYMYSVHVLYMYSVHLVNVVMHVCNTIDFMYMYM